MKAIMVMFDSLNRHMLPPYGCDWIHAPNFERLAERAITFNRSYVGSMPCMPARRELHTGRYNFLHRSWGPLEPFDDSAPAILNDRGVYSHLITDHCPYWEDGAGATYHNRYRSAEFVRGQEGDLWKAHVDPPAPPVVPRGFNKQLTEPDSMQVQDWINRSYMDTPEKQSQHRVFDLALEFLDTNSGVDDWFLQVETFDPHEPFFTHSKYEDLYPHDYAGLLFDWPAYSRVTEPPKQVEHARLKYASLVSMCDEQLGRVLDTMDQQDLWNDTMLIVCTDHGFLLGEHDWWGKAVMPWYDHLANTPLFIWDPRSGCRGETRESLVQIIDLPATLLEYFGVPCPASMQGRPLRSTLENDTPVREAALFGAFGGHVNCTDGRYVYMRAPISKNEPIYEYTLMPAHMRSPFSVEELQETAIVPPFDFTKGCPVMKIAGNEIIKSKSFKTLLFDVEKDPGQECPIKDPVVEEQMISHLLRLLDETDAPPDQFFRLGLS